MQRVFIIARAHSPPFSLTRRVAFAALSRVLLKTFKPYTHNRKTLMDGQMLVGGLI